MVLLVFVHGYTVEPRYLQPWTLPQELPLGLTSFTEYLLSNGLLRFRIPMLFAISGYLFALHDAQPHGQRLQKRVRTLLLPYFAWSGLMLLFIYALEMHSTPRAWLVENGLNQMNDTKVLLHDFAWDDWLVRWLWVPAPYQLWFLRALFVLNLVYPLIRRAVAAARGRWLFLVVAGLLWLGDIGLPFMEGEGMLFFALGVWLCKAGVDVQVPPPWLRPWRWALLWLATGCGKTWLAFAGFELAGESVYPLMVMLHKLCILAGLVAAWYGGDALVRACMARPWFVWVSAFSFFIYATHAPMVAVLINPTLRALDHWPDPHLATYLLLPMGLIAVAVLLGAALRSVSPRVYGWLTGGRGMPRT